MIASAERTLLSFSLFRALFILRQDLTSNFRCHVQFHRMLRLRRDQHTNRCRMEYDSEDRDMTLRITLRKVVSLKETKENGRGWNFHEHN